MPRDERLGRLRVVREELKRHLSPEGPLYDAIGDATATYTEGAFAGRHKVGQEGGRQEHYDFWTGIEAALRAVEATIARLEGREDARI